MKALLCWLGFHLRPKDLDDNCVFWMCSCGDQVAGRKPLLRRFSGPPADWVRWALYAHHLGNYMHRWILRSPWGTLRLHHILRSDEDRHLHDHPFDFTSFLFSGGYTEVAPADEPTAGHPVLIQDSKHWPRFSIIRKKAEHAHRLILTEPVWTFVVSGPKRRSWGFHTEQGWVNHREYLKLYPEVVEARFGKEGARQALEFDARRSR